MVIFWPMTTLMKSMGVPSHHKKKIKRVMQVKISLSGRTSSQLKMNKETVLRRMMKRRKKRM